MSEIRPLPVPTKDTEPFWKGAKEEKILIQRCQDCGSTQFYPRPSCNQCLSDQMMWIEACGRGIVYTYTINHLPANPFMKDKTPYAVAIVQLDEGIKMMANIIDSPLDQIQVGAPVEVVFEKANEEITLPQFKLAGI